MTSTTSPAVAIALGYFYAWTSHDADKAMAYIAEDIVCDTPAGRLEGVAAFRDFLEPFSRIVTGSELIAAYGDKEHAVIMYDTRTVPVPSAPGAEYLTVEDGKISYNRFIFDRAPFDAARRAAGGGRLGSRPATGDCARSARG
jgi:ketosteroid isomerase-like protein